jgi:hypothetical protein
VCLDKLFAEAVFSTTSIPLPAAGTPFQQVLGPSHRRIAIIFSVSWNTDQIIITPNLPAGAVGTATGGAILLNATFATIVISIKDVGRALVQGTWSAVAPDAAPGQTLTVTEILASQDLTDYLQSL